MEKKKKLKLEEGAGGEVVNRERLCGASAFYFGLGPLRVQLFAGISSHSEDHRPLFVCLFVCLFG